MGSTPDIDRRITDHNRGKEKFTRTGIPWNLVYQEYFENLPDARRRESFIKKMKSRKFIESLGIISPGGAGRNRVLNKKDFLELKIWLPDLSTQAHIADIISTAELEIETAENLLEKFKAQKITKIILIII